MALAKGQREVDRARDAVREEEEHVEALREEVEKAQAEAREARDVVEREREEMLRGFTEVRVALEVWHDVGGSMGRSVFERYVRRLDLRRLD